MLTYPSKHILQNYSLISNYSIYNSQQNEGIYLRPQESDNSSQDTEIVMSIEQVAQWPLISKITVKTLNFFGFCFNHKLILFVLYELIYERIILFT